MIHPRTKRCPTNFYLQTDAVCSAWRVFKLIRAPHRGTGSAEITRMLSRLTAVKGLGGLRYARGEREPREARARRKRKKKGFFPASPHFLPRAEDFRNKNRLLVVYIRRVLRVNFRYVCAAKGVWEHLACERKRVSGRLLSPPKYNSSFNRLKFCMSSASWSFLRNTLRTIPKRLAIITVSFSLKNRNHDDHDESTILPFTASDRPNIQISVSVMLTLKNGNESPTMDSRGL